MIWFLAPGLALIVAGLAIQFGRLVTGQWKSVELVLLGVRLRYLGYGALFLGVGARFLIAELPTGLDIGELVIGLVFLVFASLWFYGASDRIFRRR